MFDKALLTVATEGLGIALCTRNAGGLVRSLTIVSSLRQGGRANNGWHGVQAYHDVERSDDVEAISVALEAAWKALLASW